MLGKILTYIGNLILSNPERVVSVLSEFWETVKTNKQNKHILFLYVFCIGQGVVLLYHNHINSELKLIITQQDQKIAQQSSEIYDLKIEVSKTQLQTDITTASVSYLQGQEDIKVFGFFDKNSKKLNSVFCKRQPRLFSACHIADDKIATFNSLLFGTNTEWLNNITLQHPPYIEKAEFECRAFKSTELNEMFNANHGVACDVYGFFTWFMLSKQKIDLPRFKSLYEIAIKDVVKSREHLQHLIEKQ